MRTLAIALVLAACWLPFPALADEGAPAAGASAELEAIRADLEAARFEKAFSALDALLSRSDLAEDDTAKALALRAQARVATGDLKRAEEDWKRLLLLRPGFVPDSALTGRKALERFDKVAASIVGTLRLELDPADASVLVDGKPAAREADGTVRLATGEHVLTVEKAGFDRAELTVTVPAGEVTPLPIRLVANARSVVLRTEPDGVEVRLDGALLGTTRRPEGPSGAPSARPGVFVAENLPLGEHVFELTKPCWRTTRVRVQVNVDVRDRGPIELEPVALDPAKAVLAITGSPKGAEVRADGDVLGTVPLRGATLCAGVHRVEVRSGGRAVWRDDVELPEQGTLAVEVSPRPFAVLFGADTWPRDLEEIPRAMGSGAGLAIPDGFSPESAESLRAVLPPDTDLAAVVSPSTGGAPARIYLWSPVLGKGLPLSGPVVEARRPSRSRPSLGWRVVDSAEAGGPVVATVLAGGPAASAGAFPGERITSIGGRPVSSAAEARGTERGLEEGEPVTIALAGIDGTPRNVTMTPRSSPIVASATELTPSTLIGAAWASVDAASGEDAIALATLAEMLLDSGRYEASAAAWRRVRFEDRPGIGPGTAAYGLGRALQGLGDEAGAKEAFRRAADSRGTARTDEGPAIAPAAADHLADLGVAAEP